MLDLMIPTTGDKFWESSEINPRIAEACAHSAARVQWREIGRSEAGRPIHACFLGEGTETVLLAAGGHVKTAIVMTLAGVDAPEARQRLQKSQGFVRGAIEKG